MLANAWNIHLVVRHPAYQVFAISASGDEAIPIYQMFAISTWEESQLYPRLTLFAVEKLLS